MALNLNPIIANSFHAAMEGYCLELLHQGYEAMLTAHAYDIDWKEDTLTAHYIDFMKKLPLCREQQVSIIPQFPIYGDKYIAGTDADATAAPRIDFKFIKWFQENESDYFAEAKNVSEKNWKKKDGTDVKATYYYKRYVNTGITHLLSGYYPNNCCLIAYILNGKKTTVLAKLNLLIKSDFKDYGIVEKPKSPAKDEFYISENWIGGEKITLKHLFLQLSS
jgi:hypothetical protein